MRLSRRSLMKAGLAAAPAAAQAQAKRPNFVFLISDDHSYPDLGAYGNGAVTTPNLDRMAREGMRFDNCYVTSAQCSPNRSSILTGCAPHTTSTSRLHTPMPPWEKTIVDHLKDAGYFTGAFRKVHQGPEFERRFDYYGPARMPFAQFFNKLPANKPFYLHVGFTDPHRKYVPGAFSPPHDPKKVIVPPYLPDTPEVRQDIAHYYDFIARMDAECGQVFALLKERNLADNTLVIFTGDNGMPFPGAKGTCYDPGLRVPLLAWWPGRAPAGAVKKDLIAHVDLPCTWLEAAGIPVPEKMQGRSFLPLLTGENYQPREAVYSERNWHDNYDPIRSVRTARHKLIFNAAPHFPYRPAWDLADSPTWASYQAEARRGRLPAALRRLLQPSRPVLELYDLERDPNEFHNVIDDPSYASVRDDLMKRLSNWMEETYDYLPPGFPRQGTPSGREWPLSL